MLVLTVALKALSSLFFLSLPWVAWRRGFTVRAMSLLALAIFTLLLLWWPFSHGAEGANRMISQGVWLSAVFLMLSPILWMKLSRS